MGWDIFLDYSRLNGWLAELLGRNECIDTVHGGQRQYAPVQRRDEGVLFTGVEKDAPYPLNTRLVSKHESGEKER